jgi:hypothetical protein
MVTATTQTVDAFTPVVLPAPSGSWSQTSGTPTVTLTGSPAVNFTGPPSRAGSILVFTDGGSNTATITIQPNTATFLDADGSRRQVSIRLA